MAKRISNLICTVRAIKIKLTRLLCYFRAREKIIFLNVHFFFVFVLRHDHIPEIACFIVEIFKSVLRLEHCAAISITRERRKWWKY